MTKGTNKLSNRKPVFILSIAFIALVIFVVFNLVVVFIDAARDRNNLDLVSELRALSYRVSGLSRDATDGEAEAFGELEGVLSQMSSSWDQLKASGTELPDQALARYEDVLEDIRRQGELILGDKETIIFLHQVVNTLNERLPRLQEEHTQVVETLLDRRAPADQVAVAQAQSWRAERIGRNVDKMLAGGEDAESAADQFNRDANLFGRVLEGMRSGDVALGISRVTDTRARNSLEEIASQFEFVSNSIQEIFDATPALFRARQATDTILDKTPELLEAGAGLSDEITGLPAHRTLSNGSALVAGIIAAILLAIIGLLVYASTRRSLQETAEANEKNQQAILRLLDEIEGLGDGDLTAEATVTEDFTGAIADAINFAIIQLRDLVARIQDTAENVSAAANETRATALQLAESSRHQAGEIAEASEAVNDMAITIDKVSANASESASVAQRSVSIATKGSDVVQGNIMGMDTIREQIQDTSKRIKRLGESSQEIGDIVSLISDIADQTNILALNAAIQASMAGDAGRGFAVVADEVQRLAERSAGAAKQVASLVKAIQTDTHEAVTSMEQTTSEVVKGAQLAHDAGSALDEIQTVSTSLAQLIQDISTAAKHQAASAGQISRTMSVIQGITSQTTAATNSTAESIGELAEMAVELRESVAGFKLPGNLTAFATTEASSLILQDALGDTAMGASDVEDEMEDETDPRPDVVRAGPDLEEELKSHVFPGRDVADPAPDRETADQVAAGPMQAELEEDMARVAGADREAESNSDRELTLDEAESATQSASMDTDMVSVDLDEFSIDEPEVEERRG